MTPENRIDAGTSETKFTRPPHIRHVLIIEDDPGLQSMFRTILERNGYQVSVNDSHDDVHDQIVGNTLSPKPDIILSDNTTLMLDHGLNGVSFADKYGSKFPIILCTSEPSAIDECEKRGTIKDALLKPVSLSTLANTVNRIATEISPEQSRSV